jgi:ribosomal protein S12 methylthiotransferase
VGFVSLGCPKNLVDSEVMMGLLARAGAELTARAEDADVIVVNTCSFIESAQQESVNTILEMAEHKKFGRAQRLVVAGCLVERFRDQIQQQIPEVDAVIGTGDIERIIEAVAGQTHVTAAPELPSFLYHEAMPRVLSTPRHAAHQIARAATILFVLHHPSVARKIPQPPVRIGHTRRKSRRRRRGKSRSRPGHHFLADLGLRDGLPTLLEKLAGVESLAGCASSTPIESRHAAIAHLWRHRLVKYLDSRCSVAATCWRMKRGSSGDAFLSDRTHPRHNSRIDAARRSSRASPAGPTRFPQAGDFVRARIRLDGRLRLFRRGHAASHALGDKVDPEVIAERRDKL